MIASLTTLPVLGVPVESKALAGIDSLYSIVQMPGGVPVGTLAIGKPGAINAALLAASILALADPALDAALAGWRQRQTEAVAETPGDAGAVSPIPPGAHDRHPGRRAARPHDRDGRGTAGLSLPHPGARGRQPGRRRRGRLHLRRLRGRGGPAARSRTPSTWSRSSSRTCRSRPWSFLAATPPGAPERGRAAGHPGPAGREGFRCLAGRAR